MLLAVILLCAPLGLRYLTSWHMAQLRRRALHHDEELRRLRQSYTEVRTQLMDVYHVQRQYEVRKGRLSTDIHAARQRLEELRRGTARMAA